MFLAKTPSLRVAKKNVEKQVPAHGRKLVPFNQYDPKGRRMTVSRRHITGPPVNSNHGNAISAIMGHILNSGALRISRHANLDAVPEGTERATYYLGEYAEVGSTREVAARVRISSKNGRLPSCHIHAIVPGDVEEAEVHSAIIQAYLLRAEVRVRLVDIVEEELCGTHGHWAPVLPLVIETIVCHFEIAIGEAVAIESIEVTALKAA